MLLKKSEVAKLLRVSTRRIDQMIEEGKIPAPIRIGQQMLRYRVRDIAELTQQSPDEIIQAVNMINGGGVDSRVEDK